jgi:hypothetical protein
MMRCCSRDKWRSGRAGQHADPSALRLMLRLTWPTREITVLARNSALACDNAAVTGNSPASDPLWLQTCVAAIPLLAAMIAGFFALTNTVNRRIERLKNLNEIRKDVPESVNIDQIIEHLMLRELESIDQATTPKMKWLRRFQIIIYAFLIAAYMWTAYRFLTVHHIERFFASMNGTAYTIIGVLTGWASWDLFFRLREIRKEFKKRYSRAHSAIEERQGSAEETPRESESQDEPDSQSGADETPDKAEPVGSDDTANADKSIPPSN